MIAPTVTMCAALLLPTASAQTPPAPPQTVESRLDQLARENQELRAKIEALARQVSGAPGATAPGLDAELQELGAPGTGAPPVTADHDSPTPMTLEGRALEQSGLSQSFGGIYTKPFLTNSGGVSIGGYAEWVYEDAADSRHQFEFPRLIPFIYGQVSDHVQFASEIEIEDGHELEIEFAFVDLTITEAFNVRGGLILDPLGRFNLVHDAPVNELTARPLVDTTVIPSTLRELGGGFFGTLLHADSSAGQVAYELYFTSGFKGLFDDGTVGFDTENGLHDGKADEDIGGSEPYADINDNVAQVGRVEWSPTLGCAIGVSAHHGNYDESNDNGLLVTALDGALDGRALARWIGAQGATADVLASIELLGEWAHADIERNAFAHASGVPGDMDGWYAQASYRYYPEFLRELEHAGWLDAGSHFTFVVRRDEVDLDDFERERWTFGVNFRPNRSRTVFKFDWQVNRESDRTTASDNDAFLFSIATYF